MTRIEPTAEIGDGVLLGDGTSVWHYVQIRERATLGSGCVVGRGAYIGPEVRIGNIFAPPVEVTFQPWVKAWAEACTGLNCDGLSRGFWKSVRITVPVACTPGP